MTKKEIETLLTGEGARKEAGKTMPAKGLTLEEVFYDDSCKLGAFPVLSRE